MDNEELKEVDSSEGESDQSVDKNATVEELEDKFSFQRKEDLSHDFVLKQEEVLDDSVEEKVKEMESEDDILLEEKIPHPKEDGKVVEENLENVEEMESKDDILLEENISQQEEVNKENEKIEKEVENKEKDTTNSRKVMHPNYTAFLIVLLFGVFLGMGFALGICYFSYETKDIPKNEEEKKEEVSKPERIVEEDTIVELNSLDDVIKEVSSYEYLVSYFTRYFSEKYSLEIRSLTNQEILKSGLDALSTKDQDGYLRLPEAFSINALQDILYELYGNDLKYTDEDIQCFAKDGVLYQLKNNEYQFTGTHGHDGEGGYRFESYFVKALRNDTKGTLDVSEKILYGGYCGGICGPIVNFYKEAGKDAVGLYPTNGIYEKSDAFDKAYEEFKDKLPITTFHFEKDSKNNYVLKSIQVE